MQPLNLSSYSHLTSLFSYAGYIAGERSPGLIPLELVAAKVNGLA